MRVTVTSKLPAPIERCWELLKDTGTLLYVADGVMTYDGAKDLPEKWTADETVTVNLRPRL